MVGTIIGLKLLQDKRTHVHEWHALLRCRRGCEQLFYLLGVGVDGCGHTNRLSGHGRETPLELKNAKSKVEGASPTFPSLSHLFAIAICSLMLASFVQAKP